jgi:hypothetical protein
MKKKLKLKRWVKVLTTLIVIGLGILIYSKLGDIGSEATTNTLASILCITGWTYLVFVQIVVLSGIWEN